jgi:hypothetical protein
MKPDTITVRIIAETELDADSADLTVVIEGSMVFSGNGALKKAKEVRELVESLRQVGLDEARIKLRSVEVNSQSRNHQDVVGQVHAHHPVCLEMLPAVLSAVAAHKGAHLSRQLDLCRLCPAMHWPRLAKTVSRQMDRELISTSKTHGSFGLVRECDDGVVLRQQVRPSGGKCR